MTGARAVVVVPAHDEEAVLTRCLDALAHGARCEEFVVVVAANGCTDRTAALARAHPSHPRVLDLPAAGKPGALNAADAAFPGAPRLYVDADVEIDTATLRALADAVREGCRGAAPEPRYVLDGCTAPARAYYRVWASLPVFGPGYLGGGVFALSAGAHEVLTPFPAVIAEDEYVRRSLTPAQRARSAGAFLVRPPTTVRALVRRGARTRAGNRQLAQVLPAAAAPEAGAVSTRRHVLGLARNPRRLGDVAVFVIVTAAVHLLGELKLRRGDLGTWERDETSRRPVGDALARTSRGKS